MLCAGNGDDHCCYLGKHGVCSFLLEQTNRSDGRKWVCSLRDELGNWDNVHSDERYILHVKPKLNDIGIDVNCGDWPRPGEHCGTCGGDG